MWFTWILWSTEKDNNSVIKKFSKHTCLAVYRDNYLNLQTLERVLEIFHHNKQCTCLPKCVSYETYIKHINSVSVKYHGRHFIFRRAIQCTSSLLFSRSDWSRSSVVSLISLNSFTYDNIWLHISSSGFGIFIYYISPIMYVINHCNNF